MKRVELSVTALQPHLNEETLTELGNKDKTAMSQLTTLRNFPGGSAQREPRYSQAEFLWIYNICRSMLSGKHRKRPGEEKSKYAVA